jgi:tyrosyl-tRNA synthetase
MDNIDEVLTRAVDKIYPSKKALNKFLRSGQKLKLYQGFDPTGIQLHIGHMTGLMKLRQFQKLGHHVIFLIGDGTGQAGDPSGKSRSREKYLKIEELKQNAKDYVLQASKIVNFSGENAAQILYNSDWLNKLTLVDILNIAGHFSLQQLEERDMFIERKKRGETISMREFLYPLLQGYDSVAMDVNMEIGGSDQMFNMLCGRTLVDAYLHKEKYVLTTPLLTDSEGKKIGKTEGNVIALTSPPKEFFGMIMNLPDDVIIKSFEYITDVPMEEINTYKKAIDQGENPMKYKKLLAYTLTRMLNNKEAAEEAQKEFEKIFQKHDIPENIQKISVHDYEINLVNLLVDSKLVPSRSEVKRLIIQGGIEVDSVKITNPNYFMKVKSGIIIKIGKRKFVQIIR